MVNDRIWKMGTLFRIDPLICVGGISNWTFLEPPAIAFPTDIIGLDFYFLVFQGQLELIWKYMGLEPVNIDFAISPQGFAIPFGSNLFPR